MTDKEWQDVQEALWAFKNKVKDNPEICFVGAMVNMKKKDGSKLGERKRGH